MDSLFGNLSEISPLISTLIDLAYQTGLLFLAFWLGKLTLKGYRRKIGTLFEILASLGLGFLIYFTSKPISMFLSFGVFLNEVLALFIPVFIFYLSLILIFEKRSTEFASSYTMERTQRLIDVLAEKVENIRKGAGVSKLGFDFFKQQVDSKLKDLGSEDAKITTKRQKNNSYIIEAINHKAKYIFKFNMTSGRLEKFEREWFSVKKRIKKLFPYLLKKKKKLAGILILVGFLSFSLIKYPGGLGRGLNLTFSPGNSQTKANQTSNECVGPLVLLQNGNNLKNSTWINLNKTEVISLIEEKYKGEATLQTMPSKSLIYQGNHYLFLQVLINDKTSLCSIKLENETVCDCIKKSEFIK